MAYNGKVTCTFVVFSTNLVFKQKLEQGGHFTDEVKKHCRSMSFFSDFCSRKFRWRQAKCVSGNPA